MKTVFVAILLGLSFCSGWQTAGSPAEALTPKVELLLVDETQTLQASILVQILAQTLKSTGLFQMDAKVANVRSSFDDPLGPNPTEKRYELILVVPRGLEDGTLRQLWIVTPPITPATRSQLVATIEMIKTLIAQGTQGRLEAVGIMDDIAPAWFAAIFIRHGWLK